MSGIVGCWLARPQRFHQAAGDVGAALEALKHRGPDDCGLWHDAGRRVILGHRRLAVVDLSPGGHQPMPFVQERGEEELLVAFDGEICNYRELQRQLEPHGYEFYSDSDTEVLLAAYHHFGEDCVEHLRGAFAFAIWDGRAQRMVLARDRMGQKPLFYTTHDGCLFFASELNALRYLVPGGGMVIDRQAIDGYLSLGRITGGRTAYRNVEEFPPATIATFRTPQDNSSRRYWSVDRGARRKVRFRRAVEEADAVLREAVGLGLRSDAPVGVLLSSGFESGLIAALAAEESGEPVATLSVGIDQIGDEERRLAAAVSERHDTEHQEVVVPSDLCNQLPAIARQFGSPMADPLAVAAYLRSEAAAYHCTVALHAGGCDELFGSERHRAARRRHRASRLLGGGWASPFLRIALAILPSPRVRGTRYAAMHELFRYTRSAGQERAAMLLWDGFSRREIESLYADGCEPTADVSNQDELLNELASLGPLEMLLAADLESILPDSTCPRIDLAGMAHSVAMRSPFLDAEVVEWSASLPISMKLRGRQSQRVLRALAKRYLPRDVVFSQSREPDLPVERWLKDDLSEMRDDLILSREGLIGDLFDRDALETLLSRRGERRMSAERWSRSVWSLLMLALWDRECASIGQTVPLAKSA